MKFLKSTLLVIVLFAAACNHSSKSSDGLNEFETVSPKESEANKFLLPQQNNIADTSAKPQEKKSGYQSKDNPETKLN